MCVLLGFFRFFLRCINSILQLRKKQDLLFLKKKIQTISYIQFVSKITIKTTKSLVTYLVYITINITIVYITISSLDYLKQNKFMHVYK